MSNAPYNAQRSHLLRNLLRSYTYVCPPNMMIHFGFWPAASPAWAPCTISRILIHKTCCLLDEGTSTHPWTHWGRCTFFNNPHEDLLSSHNQTCTESRCKPYQSAFGLSNHSKEHALVQYEAPLQGSGKHIKVGPINVACCLVHFCLAGNVTFADAKHCWVGNVICKFSGSTVRGRVPLIILEGNRLRLTRSFQREGYPSFSLQAN
jgi:hypothetical protein